MNLGKLRGAFGWRRYTAESEQNAVTYRKGSPYSPSGVGYEIQVEYFPEKARLVFKTFTYERTGTGQLDISIYEEIWQPWQLSEVLYRYLDVINQTYVG